MRKKKWLEDLVQTINHEADGTCAGSILGGFQDQAEKSPEQPGVTSLLTLL